MKFYNKELCDGYITASKIIYKTEKYGSLVFGGLGFLFGYIAMVVLLTQAEQEVPFLFLILLKIFFYWFSFLIVMRTIKIFIVFGDILIGLSNKLGKKNNGN